MFDSIELIFWGAILLVLWLRGLARAAQRQRESDAVPGSDAGERVIAPEAPRGRAERREGTAARSSTRVQRAREGRASAADQRAKEARRPDQRRPPPAKRGPVQRPARSEREPAKPKRRSFLETWAEMAKELEAGAEERAGRREGGLAQGAGVPGKAADETVLVPGRRVEPSAPPGLFDDEIRAPFTEADRHRPAQTPPATLSGSPPSLATARTRTGGALDRFERYRPLQRAVLLAEILGTPPGLTDREIGSDRWSPGPGDGPGR